MKYNLTEQVRRALSMQRVQAAKEDFPFFCKTHLGEKFPLPFSPMHHDFANLLTQAEEERGVRIAFAAPRGHGKSAILCAYILWCICLRKEEFIVIISNTAALAERHLANVKKELMANELLIEDFPNATEGPGKSPRPEQWRENEIVTRNGVMVSAFGTGTNIRGRTFGAHRPTLFILDDLESKEQVRSEEQREKLREWLTSDPLKAGTPSTNAIVVGTVLEIDSVLVQLLDPQKFPGWTTRKYQAVLSWAKQIELWLRWEKIYVGLDEFEGRKGKETARAFFDANREAMLEGTKVLWPEMEDYYALMEQKLREGEISFASEKQNEPTSRKSRIFREEKGNYWPDRYPTFQQLKASVSKKSYIVAACDPSMASEKGDGDPSAIVVVLYDPESQTSYVVDTSIEWRDTDQLISDIVSFHRSHTFRYLVYESNGFQSLLIQRLEKAIKDAGLKLDIRPRRNQSNKIVRMRDIQADFNVGRIQLSRKDRIFNNQLFQFPDAAHDDGPDALEMAIQELATDKVLEPLGPAQRSSRSFDEDPRQSAIRDLTKSLLEGTDYEFDEDDESCGGLFPD